jgi:hypothetical protein
MKAKNIIWGLILVFLGTIFILKNFGVIYFNWHSIFRLWPFIIVFIGITILPVKTWIKIFLAVIALGAVIAMMAYYPGEKNEFSFDWWSNKDRTENWERGREVDQTIIEPYDTTITEASFIFDAAAGSFKIRNSSAELFEFKRWGGFGKYHYAISGMGNSREIKIDFDGSNIGRNKVTNNVEIKLNTMPLWDLRINVGAADMDLDLSEYSINRIDVEGGASSIGIKLGSKCESTVVDIESGASSITIEIPREFACEVKTSTVLSSKDLDGFNKVSEGTYVTDNFSGSAKNIVIKLDAAVSSLTVKRY